MAMSIRLEEFLKENRVSYAVIPHARTSTTATTAAAEHVPRSMLAKVVMVKANGEPVMTVFPGDFDLDLLKLETVLGTGDLKVEKEKEFEDLFPDCEVGAMPPFGVLYDLPTYVDIRLTENPELFINSGDHEEGIRLMTSDYLRLAGAKVVDIVQG